MMGSMQNGLGSSRVIFLCEAHGDQVLMRLDEGKDAFGRDCAEKYVGECVRTKQYATFAIPYL